METLIVILISVLIAQTGVYIYSHFFDINSKKEAAATIKMFEAATNNFVLEKENFNRIIAGRDSTIERIQNDYRKLADSYNMVLKYLPNLFQKEAIRHITTGTQTEDDVKILSEYYDWLKTIKYTDDKTELE